MQGALDKLRKMTWYYLRFYEQNHRVGWVLRVSTSIKTWFESPEAIAPVRDSTRLFWNIIREGQDAGEIRQDINLRAVTYVYFGGLNYMVELWLLRNRSYSLIAYAGVFTDIIITAIENRDRQAAPFICPYIASPELLKPIHERSGSLNISEEGGKSNATVRKGSHNHRQ